MNTLNRHFPHFYAKFVLDFTLTFFIYGSAGASRLYTAEKFIEFVLQNLSAMLGVFFPSPRASTLPGLCYQLLCTIVNIGLRFEVARGHLLHPLLHPAGPLFVKLRTYRRIDQIGQKILSQLAKGVKIVWLG